MNTIFVDRQSLESRRATVEEIKRRTSSSGFPRFWSSRRWCQRWLFVIFKISQAFDLPRGHHNWRHGPHPLRVFLSLLQVSTFSIFFKSTVLPQSWCLHPRQTDPAGMMIILLPFGPLSTFPQGGNLLRGSQPRHLDRRLVLSQKSLKSLSKVSQKSLKGLSKVSQTTHCWTDGWWPSELIAYDG